MDCRHANLLLLFYRPGSTSELSAEDTSALESHLAACTACAARLKNQQAIDTTIATAINDVPVPGSLADRLKTQVAVYRKLMVRLRVVRFAMAASVLVLLYGAYIAVTRPVLDIPGLADDQDRYWQAPAHTAADWLVTNGLSDTLPEPFDLQLVTFAGRRDLQGVSTQAMRLEGTGRQSAWVYFLRPGDFHLRDAETGQYTSNVAVRVYRDLPGGWIVVVAYTGNNFNAFLRGPGADA